MVWQAYTTLEYVVWLSRLCYNFTFTSISLSGRPFLHDIMRGSLKIWFSNGCCFIWFHFLVRISFRFGLNYWVVLFHEGQNSFLCFISLQEGLCPFLKFHLWECTVNKFLQIASLHRVFFFNVVMFSSNVMFEEFQTLQTEHFSNDF